MSEKQKNKARPRFPGAKGALPKERLEVPRFIIVDDVISPKPVPADEYSELERYKIERLRTISGEMLDILRIETGNFDRRIIKRLDIYIKAIEEFKLNIAKVGIVGGMLTDMLSDHIESGAFDAGLSNVAVEFRRFHHDLMESNEDWQRFSLRDKSELENSSVDSQVSDTVRNVSTELEELSDHVDEKVVDALKSYDELSRELEFELGVDGKKAEIALARVRVLENLTIASVAGSVQLAKRISVDENEIEPKKSWIGDEVSSKLRRSKLRGLSDTLYSVIGWIAKIFTR